ncbi:hypothetical protein Tco_0987718 [Tanacetum coccineum]
MLLESERKLVMLLATGLSPSGCSILLLRLAARRLYYSPTTLFSWFRLLPFHSLLLRESLLLSFPLATKMFQFARLYFALPMIRQQIEKVKLFGESPDQCLFSTPDAFRRFLGPSSSLGA